jgi:hypothetical protein
MPSISNNNRFLLTISLVISIFVVQSVGYGWIIEQNFIKIEEGDTLWNISRQLLGDGSRYEEIWQNRLSPAKYKNPNLIFPGMLFRYVGKNIINKPGEVHHEFPNVPTENFNQIIENSNAAIIKIDLIQNDVKDIYRTLEKIEKHVGHPDESTRHFKQIIDNSNAAVIRIDLIQKEVIKLNNTLEKIEKKNVR